LVVSSHILIVDDEADNLGYLYQEFEGISSVEVKHPRDVTRDDIAQADLVLVDYKLDYWDDRYAETSSASMQPLDGLALAGIYRSVSGVMTDRPLAIALYSAQLGDLASIPFQTRAHILARLTSLEWVFSKANLSAGSEDVDVPDLAVRAAAIAESVQKLPDAWPTEPSAVRDVVGDLLRAPASGPPAEACWQDVLRCHPPMYELSSASHGIWFLDWLLLDILPYATFLIGRMTLAARLRVTPAGLDALLARDSRLSELLKNCTYSGILSGFDGPRWWAALVDDAIREYRASNPGCGVLEFVSVYGGGEPEMFTGDSPVVCYDLELTRLPDLYPRAQTVEIAPDGWPTYAEPAHCERTLLGEPLIAALAKRAEAVVIVRTGINE
jgi:hypothetical protein